MPNSYTRHSLYIESRSAGSLPPGLCWQKPTPSPWNLGDILPASPSYRSVLPETQNTTRKYSEQHQASDLLENIQSIERYHDLVNTGFGNPWADIASHCRSLNTDECRANSTLLSVLRGRHWPTKVLTGLAQELLLNDWWIMAQGAGSNWSPRGRRPQILVLSWNFGNRISASYRTTLLHSI